MCESITPVQTSPDRRPDKANLTHFKFVYFSNEIFCKTVDLGEKHFEIIVKDVDHVLSITMNNLIKSYSMKGETLAKYNCFYLR